MRDGAGSWGQKVQAALDAYNTAGGLCLQTEGLVPGDPTDARAVQLACAVCLRKKGERPAAGQLVMTLLKSDETDFDVLLEYAIQVRLRNRDSSASCERWGTAHHSRLVLPPPLVALRGCPLLMYERRHCETRLAFPGLKGERSPGSQLPSRT